MKTSLTCRSNDSGKVGHINGTFKDSRRGASHKYRVAQTGPLYEQVAATGVRLHARI